MATQIHPYRVAMRWQGGRDGEGDLVGDHGLRESVRTPPEFGGPGGATNPEELLTGAIAACYSITFGIVATNRKLPYTGIETEAVGEVDQSGMSFTFARVTLRPTITLTSEATEEHETLAFDIAHKADAYCIVTNAVRGKVQVVVEPKVLRA